MSHVLIIEDDPLIASLVEAILEEEEGVSSTSIVSTERDTVSSASTLPQALIVADVHLRSGDSISAVAFIRDELGIVPVILTTGAHVSAIVADERAVVLRKLFTSKQLAHAYRDLAVAHSIGVTMGTNARSQPTSFECPCTRSFPLPSTGDPRTSEKLTVRQI